MAIRDCGRMAVVRTSCTSANPGRRFWSCPADRENRCSRFLGWRDPPMCTRAVEVIPGLLRARNHLEQDVIPELRYAKLVLESQNRKLRYELMVKNVMIFLLVMVIVLRYVF